MYTVTRKHSFSYGHRLREHPGNCSRLHGHNGVLFVTVGSDALDGGGMVVDFHEIKRTVARWVDDTLDHRLVLQRGDPAAALLQEAGEEIRVVDFEPTAENLARHVYEALTALGLPVREIVFEETENCRACYRPG
ncbi:MAG: 6-pyruvoyl tetrahydropterin synthase family protein [Candidatus Eisenbacteria bacterium]